MTKLTIVRGVSGSGKSTWARQQNAFVVNRDSMRAAFFPMSDAEYYKSPILRDMEDSVTRIQDAAIKSNLEAGKDVIVDNTNIEWKYVKALAQIGYDAGAEVELKVFDVSLNDCVQRNYFRSVAGGRDVPLEAIKRQHSRFQSTKDKQLVPQFIPRPYNGTPGAPKAFLVDVDGTLAHMRTRGPFDWKRVEEDEVDEAVSLVVRSLNKSAEFYILVMSGRDSSCRRETEDWLLDNDIPFDGLFMRPEGDMRKDNIVKSELFDTYVRDNFDVQFVLDDRNQVVKMWRAMGIKCLQVAEGNF